jgi:hypothetical protein
VHPCSWRAFGNAKYNMKHHGLEDPSMTKKRKQGGVTHYGLAIYIKKYLKAKEE